MAKLHHTVVLALAIAAFVPSFAAADEVLVRSCFGFGPTTTTCSTPGGNFRGLYHEIWVFWGSGFTGEVAAMVASNGYAHTYSCRVAGGLALSCANGESGTYSEGDAYSFTGRTTGPLASGPSVGQWRVELRD